MADDAASVEPVSADMPATDGYPAGNTGDAEGSSPAAGEMADAAPEPTPAAEPPTDSTTTTVTENTDLLASAEQRLRELLPGVQDQSVLEELAGLADSAALERLVQRGKPPPKANFQRSAAKGPAFTGAGENMFKAQQSQQVSQERGKAFGNVDSKALAVGGAGQGGGLGLNRPGFGPKVTHFAGGQRGSISKSLMIDDELGSAWLKMKDDDSPVTYVIGVYSADNKSLNLHSSGEGGLQGFKAQLPENVAWGGFRCYGVDKRGGVECKRPKFVFVCYKPESVSQIKKAKQAAHKGDVKDAFPGAHLDLIVETMDDLEEQSIITKLQAATGAHKPNGYEFQDGVFLEADFYGLGIGSSCKGESAIN